MNKVDMENTVPTASARVGCKWKAGAQDRDTPSKKKCDGTKKIVVRRTFNKSTKQSMLAVLKKAISSPSSLDQADSGGELLASVLQEVDSEIYIRS